MRRRRFLAIVPGFVFAARTKAVFAASRDALFALGDGGALIPVAVRANGAFLPPGSNDGGPSATLDANAIAALHAAGDRVNVIFGGRVVASVRTTISNGQAVIEVPATLRLGGNVTALASPTLRGGARSARRAPTASERAAALALAAARLGTAASRLTVRNLTAIDLGMGTALVGTVSAKGNGSPRVDRRAFFVAEPHGETYAATLFNRQTVTVSEPLLEEAGEYLIDTLQLENATQALVTHVLGYDADTYTIYTRRTRARTWQAVYAGGGAAM